MNAYRPLYPSTWFSPAEPGKFWAALFGADGVLLAERKVDAVIARKVGKAWERDIAAGRELTCPDCLGEPGPRFCPTCKDSGFIEKEVAL